MQQVYEFLKKAGVYYLATDEGGQPRVRPFGTVDIFEGRLYIQTGRSKDVYRQIMQNPRVELCAFLDGRWIRVAATAAQDDRLEAERHMLDAYPSLQSRYAPGDGNTVVFALTDATAVISSFTADPVIVHF